ASTNVGLDVEHCARVEDAAQHESACAWPIARLEPSSRPFDVCIGQCVPFLQHAIRASGVGCQPAHTAMLPAHNARAAANAAKRRNMVTALLACGSSRVVSNGPIDG